MGERPAFDEAKRGSAELLILALVLLLRRRVR